MKKVLLILVLLIGVTFASLSVESFEVSPSTVKPGEDASIIITLKNIQPTGTTTATSAKNVALYHPSVQGILFKTDSPTVVGTIEVGASAIASIPIMVSQEAKGGIIATTFVIRQDGQNDQVLTVPVKVVNPPILVFSLDKQTIQGTDTLNISVANNGGSIRKLTIKINNTDKFSLVGTDQVFLANVTDSANFLLPIDSRNANEGINTMVLTLSYESEGGEIATETKTISVNVKKEKSDIIITQESQIITSKDNLLELKVRNTGRYLENFRIAITDESIKPKESNEIKLGNFGADEEKKISINVFVNAKPGVRDTGIKLKWVENDVEKEESATIPIVISSDADVGIYIDSKPSPLVVGSDHTLSILVSNIGSYKIENVEVSLEDNEIFEIFNTQKSQYIGGLENDDFSTVQYKIRVKKIAAGTYPLALSVKYKDQSGIWVSKSITTNILVRAEDPTKAGTNNNLLIFAAAVLIILGIGYWLYRRNKKKQLISK